MGWFDHNMGSWGWPGMLFAMAVFWGLLITVIVLVLHFRGRSGTPTADTGALGAAELLLAERFARGEIDENEYRGRLEALHEALHTAGRS
jgi:putative membrane protein